jgi:hypothetical protein
VKKLRKQLRRSCGELSNFAERPLENLAGINMGEIYDMNKITLPEVTPAQLTIICESLGQAYGRKLKKVQRMDGPRSAKMTEELSACQVVLQEMLMVANRQELSPGTGHFSHLRGAKNQRVTNGF